MIVCRLAFFLLFLGVVDTKANGGKKVNLIGVTRGAPGTPIHVYPDVAWSFTVYGQDLPADGYVLTSRSTCQGLHLKNKDKLDLPLTTVWPSKEKQPVLSVPNRFVTLRAMEGVPFKYDKREKFLICHPEIEQGQDLMVIRSKTRRIDWWRCIVILFLLAGSAFCSGISVAFFTYSTDELVSIIEASIDQTEKQYAQQILWYRSKSNYLICCFASANCVVNVLITSFCEDIFRNYRSSMIISILASTCLTVLLGEIMPQGLCSRYGLYFAAKTRHVTLILFIVMAPFAWPLSKIIDLLLGREAREVLSRDQLKKLLTHHANNLCGDQEGDILRRTVKFQDMTVRDIMKPLSDIFALSDHFQYTPELALMLVERGMYSRLPIFSGKNCKSIYGCVNMSDLLNKPKDGQTIAQIMAETTSHLRFAPIDMKLQQLSEEMKTGEHHMCVVFDYRFNRNEVIGLVTSEDVWEQLFGDIQDDLDLAFGNKRTGFRKDQATLDWYKEKKGPFTCNQQLAIIQQIYDLCPELRWLGLNVHTMRHLLPSNALRLVRNGLTLDCDPNKMYVVCSGEFDAKAGALSNWNLARISVASETSGSDTNTMKKFHCRNGKVWILNCGLTRSVALHFVDTFSVFRSEPPRYLGVSELDQARRLVARRDLHYFTITHSTLIDAIRLCGAGEDAIEYFEHPKENTSQLSKKSSKLRKDWARSVNKKKSSETERLLSMTQASTEDSAGEESLTLARTQSSTDTKK